MTPTLPTSPAARPATTFPPPPIEPVIRVEGLVKRYGATTVLDGVTFAVRPGELFGLLGTNGAGKTTTAEILQGLRRADGGTAHVLGFDPATQGEALRRRIGAQLQDAALPDRMRVGEAVDLFASIHPDPRPVGELLDEWDLARLERRPFGALSGGERQRLFVALALVGRPEVVFLDELTQNLDPVARRHTWDVVRQVRDAGTTVVLVTHDVEEAERLCDRLVVMHRGRVVAAGTPADVAAGDDDTTTVTFTDPEIDVDGFARLPGVERIERLGDVIHIAGHGPVLAYVGAHLVGVGRPAIDLAASRRTLEQRIAAITEADASPATTSAQSRQER